MKPGSEALRRVIASPILSVVHHVVCEEVQRPMNRIPVCPFSQRLEILLSLKGLADRVAFHVVDITRPRPDRLLEKTRGTTALPVLETTEGWIIKESMVIQRYLEDVFPDPPVAQRDPYRRAVENMLIAQEGDFGMWGYRYVMNADPAKRDGFRQGCSTATPG